VPGGQDVAGSARATEARRWVEARAGEMADLVEALVAVDTENPPGRGLAECASVLRAALQRLDMAPEIIELAPSADLEDPCVVRATAGDGAKLVYFHGHFDVVPAQRRDQFVPQRRDGRITGRGTADMKGGLVSMIYGAAAARALGLLGDARVVLHFVCDEETGSAAGSGHLRDAELIDPGAAAMVTPEPTGGVVWHASRGAITLRVTVSGREAHVGQAHLGVNAFEHMVEIARPLNALAHDLLEERGSTLVVGGAAGAGANFNVVPGAAWFSVDRRFNPEEDLDEEMERLTETIERAATARGADVSIEVLQRQPSGHTEATSPAAVTLGRCVAAVQRAEARFEVCPGSLDTRWYAQLGIPAFGYGAGRLDVAHGPDEFIEQAAMGRCAAVYALFAGAITQ
jgi:succinyl-diaminopimelate desuccinylase